MALRFWAYGSAVDPVSISDVLVSTSFPVLYLRYAISWSTLIVLALLILLWTRSQEKIDQRTATLILEMR